MKVRSSVNFFSEMNFEWLSKKKTGFYVCNPAGMLIWPACFEAELPTFELCMLFCLPVCEFGTFLAIADWPIAGVFAYTVYICKSLRILLEAWFTSFPR